METDNATKEMIVHLNLDQQIIDDVQLWLSNDIRFDRAHHYDEIVMVITYVIT